MFRNLSQCSKHAAQHHDILYLFLFSHHKPLKTISATMRLSTLLLLMSIICASCTKKDIKQPENEITLPIIANSISNQQIRAFAEDKNGHIWIGTFRGLNKFTSHEYHQYFCTNNSSGLPDNQSDSGFAMRLERQAMGFYRQRCVYLYR